jgi:hypothetical protein
MAAVMTAAAMATPPAVMAAPAAAMAAPPAVMAAPPAVMAPPMMAVVAVAGKRNGWKRQPRDNGGGERKFS